MELILARHGNTFLENEPSVWIGAKEDTPLVATGLQQAKILGIALQQAAIKPSAVYCGPLQRTVMYAQLALEICAPTLRPLVDRRLNEIDYGPWGGLTSQQIRENVGDATFEAWDIHSRWPEQAGWGRSAQTFIEEVASFTAERLLKHRPGEKILVVTSNGRLRYFLNLVPGAWAFHVQQHRFKVATGNICRLYYQPPQWSLDFWNVAPAKGLGQPLVPT